MFKFIVVHEGGEERLVNLAWVEEVREESGGRAVIFFAFQGLDTIEQDHIVCDEPYHEVRAMVLK